MKRIITFGEIMMRLNPQEYVRFTQARSFEASYAGGEANVAVSLANFGMDAAFVSTNVADFNACKLCDRFSGIFCTTPMPLCHLGAYPGKGPVPGS